MESYSFYGLRRSGNHAVLEWLIKNMGGGEKRNVVKKNRIIQCGRAAYINEANTYPSHDEIDLDVKFCKNTFENLIVAYEDVPSSYSLANTHRNKKIVVVRDIFNLFSSRFKKMELNKTPYYKEAMRIDEKSVEIWKEHTKSNSILIIFEKWVESKEYRDYICEKMGIPNYDIKNTITNFGGGSSFTGKTLPTTEELKSRSKMIDLPMDVTGRLEKPDIKEIRKKLGFLDTKKIMVLGDSHSLVFNHYRGDEYFFDVNVVHGATARGSINPNTKTNSLNIFTKCLKKYKADKLIVMLGEVDCGYLIWYKNKYEGKTIKSQLNDSISKLFEFLKIHVEEYYYKKDIIVLGAPPPTIKDNTEKKFLKGARKSIDTPIEKRTKLTIEYNQLLKEISHTKGYEYIDINENVMEGLNVKDKYLSNDPYDHHLNPETTIDIWVDKLNELFL